MLASVPELTGGTMLSKERRKNKRAILLKGFESKRRISF
jgi:hypothetical protein